MKLGDDSSVEPIIDLIGSSGGGVWDFDGSMDYSAAAAMPNHHALVLASFLGANFITMISSRKKAA